MVFSCHAKAVAAGMVWQLVSPSLWSRLKRFSNYWMDYHKIWSTDSVYDHNTAKQMTFPSAAAVRCQTLAC